jgi:hypothetical protein
MNWTTQRSEGSSHDLSDRSPRAKRRAPGQPKLCDLLNRQKSVGYVKQVATVEVTTDRRRLS